MRTAALKLLLALVAAALALVAPELAFAQNFGFDTPPSANDPALPPALRDLASRILPVYQDSDTDRYLVNVAALQMAVGDPAAAHATRLTLLERQQAAEQRALPTGRRAFVYNVYVQARANESSERPFTSAYGDAFRDTFGRLDDLSAYELESWFATPLEPLQAAVQHILDSQQDKNSIDLATALDLMQAWFAFESYRSFGNVVRPLLQEDKEKRYVIDENLEIPISADVTIAAALIRPRGATGTGTLPTLLEFTLDRSKWSSRDAAAHGYVSLIAIARIAGDPKFRPRAPFESDGDDARAVIDWITQQSWSDGRVGMQGAGYGGFIAWAVAKRPPPALKAIATSDPIAPGIDVPMSNRIVHNSAYRWAYELTAEPGDELVNDSARWRSFDEDWYRSGASYRDMPTLPGRGQAIFHGWLNHPSYDRFWQKWLPFGAEFADVDIPVLTVTGYYSAGETAALYYFTEHHANDASANHALLIGPYDAQAVQRGAAPAASEITLDSAALIDPNDARYAWFGHALKGAERPPLLGANVNYELAGANEWRHEAALDAPEVKPLRFYLAAAPEGAMHRLATEKAKPPMALTETLDLKTRDDPEWRPSPAIVRTELEERDGTLFVTEPFAEGLDVAGQLHGELDFTINKQDVDLVVALYELRASGEYVRLFEPAYAFRASYARDRVHRRLLVAGVRQTLPFHSEKMIGRRLEPGSRLALTIGINKRADQQINYGGGGDVSEEAIEMAGAPVRIRWHEGSFVEIPTR